MRRYIQLMGLLLLSLLSSCSDSRPTLHVFCWTELLSPEILSEFEEKYNCRVVADAFDSNEVMFAKLRAGFYGYDIILPSNYYVELMIEQGSGLSRIDYENIPNTKNLDKAYFKPLSQKVLDYGVPFIISYTGVGYRHDRLKDLDQSWGVFSRRDLKGRMTMLNDMRETIGAALRYLGYSINTINPEEVDKAALLINKWKKNLAKFENEQYQNGIATAEYLVVQGYGGDILQVASENPEVHFYIPKEGGIFSCDLFVIPNSAPQKDLAYKFINFLLEPHIAVKVMMHTFLPAPNKAAYLLLPEEIRSNQGMFPNQETLQKLEVIEDLGENISIYNKAWDRIKE